MAEKRRFFLPLFPDLRDEVHGDLTREVRDHRRMLRRLRRFLADLVQYLNDQVDALVAVTTAAAAFTDNAVMRADGTGGSIQDSDATIDDSGNLTIPTGDLYVVAGSVAIGAASTAIDLEVKGATGVDALARVTTGGGGTPALGVYDGNRDWRVQIGSPNSPLEITNSTLGVTPLTIANDINNDNALYIDNSGNVGIGTTAPEVKAHVLEGGTPGTPTTTADTVAIFQNSAAAGDSALVSIVGGASATSQLLFGDTASDLVGRILYSHAQDAMRFYTNLNERARIDSSGNLLVGTATSPSANDGKVLVFGDNAADPTMGSNTAGVYGKDVAGTVELFAVDEAGNATQLSPHDPETGEWIFYSENVKTGRRVRVDMERLVRAVEKLTGETFMEEL